MVDHNGPNRSGGLGVWPVLVVHRMGDRLVVALDELSNPGVRVVGASPAGGRTFGELGPVELVLRDTNGAPWARTVLNAGTTENSLVLAEFYQRGDRWRFRAVGQGFGRLRVSLPLQPGGVRPG